MTAKVFLRSLISVTCAVLLYFLFFILDIFTEFVSAQMFSVIMFSFIITALAYIRITSDIGKYIGATLLMTILSAVIFSFSLPIGFKLLYYAVYFTVLSLSYILWVRFMKKFTSIGWRFLPWLDTAVTGTVISLGFYYLFGFTTELPFFLKESFIRFSMIGISVSMAVMTVPFPQKQNKV